MQRKSLNDKSMHKRNVITSFLSEGDLMTGWVMVGVGGGGKEGYVIEHPYL
jgi:hypothetical protein